MFAWEQRKLGEVYGKIENAFVGTATPYYVGKENGHFYLESNNVKDGHINRNNEIFINDEFYKKQKNKWLHTGDIVIVQSGHVGHSAVIPKELNNIAAHALIMFRYPVEKVEPNFINYQFQTIQSKKKIENITTGNTIKHILASDLRNFSVSMPVYSEEEKIGSFFQQLDSLIALHQRKPFIENGGIKMITSNFTCDSLFKDYFEFWIKLYKEGAVRPVTLEKYRNNHKHITKIIPNLKMKDFDRNAYQELLNQYALTHERQTVIDFHHQVKGAILDAVDDGLIDRDPTRKAIFKGKAPREKKQKYLNQFELHNLLEDLDLGMEITWDWLILLIAKTGLRFSEALGLTPADFDFARQTISVNKTWDYKTNTGFQPTKNRSSIRKVQMDWQLGMQFQHLIKNLNEDEPIFVNGPVCNSTPNNCLARHCRKCGIPEISIHGLRHTHASLLMFAGVSIASVSRRLGHSSITTTQKVYMHIISELENQDNDLVMRYLSSLS